MSKIYDFKCGNNIVNKKNGVLLETAIKAYDNDGKLLYDERTEFAFSTNKYGQEEVSILWNFSDAVMYRIGLHGCYNPTYQEFSYADRTLMIVDEKAKILISPIE